MMTNSTVKALKISAVVLYALGALAALVAIITNNINIMAMVPALVLAGVILRSLPVISTNREIDRMFNHY